MLYCEACSKSVAYCMLVEGTVHNIYNVRQFACMLPACILEVYCINCCERNHIFLYVAQVSCAGLSHPCMPNADIKTVHFGDRCNIVCFN